MSEEIIKKEECNCDDEFCNCEEIEKTEENTEEENICTGNCSCCSCHE